MWLSIAEEQEEQLDRRGRSEGVVFHLSCQLRLEEREQELVERYGQDRYPIAFLGMDDIRDFRPRHDDERALTLDRLTAGWSVSSRFVTDLLRVATTIEENSREFKELLFVFASYGSQRDIEL
jgi:hypothetical protein